jgi:hypothetical protein
MLVVLTFEEIEKLTGVEEKRLRYLDIVGWLERLGKVTRNPFLWYRLGRVHLILEDRLEAQRCFAEAARRLPEGSVYKAPAARLARNLAQ